MARSIFSKTFYFFFTTYTMCNSISIIIEFCTTICTCFFFFQIFTFYLFLKKGIHARSLRRFSNFSFCLFQNSALLLHSLQCLSPLMSHLRQTLLNISLTVGLNIEFTPAPPSYFSTRKFSSPRAA